jgi:hypothetical protein
MWANIFLCNVDNHLPIYIHHNTHEGHNKNSSNVNSVAVLLHRVALGDVTDVSEVHSVSMCVGWWIGVYVTLCFEKNGEW